VSQTFDELQFNPSQQSEPTSSQLPPSVMQPPVQVLELGLQLRPSQQGEPVLQVWPIATQLPSQV
jgi:hypothetical protein